MIAYKNILYNFVQKFIIKLDRKMENYFFRNEEIIITSPKNFFVFGESKRALCMSLMHSETWPRLCE